MGHGLVNSGAALNVGRIVAGVNTLCVSPVRHGTDAPVGSSVPCREMREARGAPATGPAAVRAAGPVWSGTGPLSGSLVQQDPSSVQTAHEAGASGSAPVEYQVDFHLWPL